MGKAISFRMIFSLHLTTLLIFLIASTVHARSTLYIPNQASDSVSVIDGNTYAILKTIPVGDEPYGVGVSPDGKIVFVTNMRSNSVSAISTGTNAVIKTVNVGRAPFGVAVNPNGRYAYVANTDDDSITVIDTASYNVMESVKVGDAPHGIAVHPDGSRRYVTNYNNATVSVLNDNSPGVKTIPVGVAPHGIAIHPSGAYVYVANVMGGNVSVISTSTEKVIKTIRTGTWPFCPVVDPSGKYLYVSNSGDRTVSVVDVASHAVVGTISVGQNPHGIAFDATGSKAYVANEGGNSLSVIDTATQSVVATAFAGNQPVAFGDFLRDTSKDSYPTDTQSFVYSSTDLPVIADDPSQAKPFAIGSVAYGKDILSFRVGFPQFSKPVDIYLGLFIPATNPEVLLITPEKILKPLSEGFVPYASQTTGPIDEAILPDLPMSALPAVQYRLFSIVTPAGSLQSYSIWVTSFFGQYSLPGVAAAIVDAFEGDAYFDAPMLAMDSGYSLRQVADAAMSGRLLSTGDIKTSSGSMEPPANMAYGEIIAPTTKTGLSEWKPRSLTEIRMVMEEELKKNNWDAEEETKAFRKRIVTLMLGLAESGYSLPEIITGFLVDNIKIEDYGDRERTIFVDENGKRIPPAGSPPEQGVFSGTQGVPCPDADNDDYKTGAGCGDWAGDCDDTNPNRNPGMIEDCSDGIDNDCDGMVDDQDTGGCFPNCSQTDYPQTCGPTCIPAGAQCCEPGGGYCEVGWHCEYAQAKCCEDGKVLCPGNSGFCIPPGFEYQCP